MISTVNCLCLYLSLISLLVKQKGLGFVFVLWNICRAGTFQSAFPMSDWKAFSRFYLNLQKNLEVCWSWCNLHIQQMALHGKIQLGGELWSNHLYCCIHITSIINYILVYMYYILGHYSLLLTHSVSSGPIKIKLPPRHLGHSLNYNNMQGQPYSCKRKTVTCYLPNLFQSEDFSRIFVATQTICIGSHFWLSMIRVLAISAVLV